MSKLPEIYTEDEMYKEACSEVVANDLNEDFETAMANTLNRYGFPNLQELRRRTGKDIYSIIKHFNLMQDPVMYDRHQNKEGDYMFSSTYISSKHYYKLLSEAEKMNEKYAGRFIRNLTYLRRNKPKVTVLTVDDISIGSRCLSRFEYSCFVEQLFQLVTPPEVLYNTDTRRYSIEYRDKPKERIDKYKYGTPYKSATKILLNLMNGDDNIVKVAKYEWNPARTRYVKDEDQTVAVLEKEKLILKAFKDYISQLLKDTTRANHLYERHTKLIGGFMPSTDISHGEWLSFPGLTREPYPWQRAGVAEGLTRKAVMYVWDVGAGKTMTMVVLANELKRMSICSKIMFVLPNDTLMQDFLREAKELYPDNHYLIIDRVKFSRSQKRLEYLNEIKKGHYDAVMITSSTYDLIDLSKHYYTSQKKELLRRTKAARAAARSIDDRRRLKQEITAIEKELNKLAFRKESPTDCFEELGIDALFVDECQNYRRIPMKSGHSNINGLSSSGAAKSRRHLEKTHYTLSHYESGRVVFATGTPLENTIAEQYVYQTYLQREDLAYLSLSSPDTWFSEFTEAIQYYGVAPNGQDFKLKTRLRFHNLPELNRMVRGFANFHHIRNGELSLPRFNGFKDILIPATDDEINFYEELGKKLDLLSKGEISRKEFNTLTAIVLARMAALDIRLIDPNIPTPDGTTKVDVCAKSIMKLYQKHPDKSQVVFCDVGVPKEGFNLYDLLKEKLIKDGSLNASEVKFIHDAVSQKDKRELLSDFNEAKIKVLIGSTQKLGIGVNIQKNLIAAHFLDVPWTPAKLQQKMGRIIRAGNTCDEIYILRYIKQRSFDAFSWEIIGSKLDFINQYNSYQFGESYRDSDDITALSELSCAEAKALALDDNDVKRHAELENELSRVKSAYRARAGQLLELKEKMRILPLEIENHDRYVAMIEKDIKHYASVRTEISREKREAFGIAIMEAIKANKSCRRFTYQSFTIEVPLRENIQLKPYIFLYGVSGGRYKIDMHAKTPKGVCQILDYYLGKQLLIMKQRHNKLADKKTEELRTASEEIVKGNEYTDKLDTLVNELDQLEKELGITL